MKIIKLAVSDFSLKFLLLTFLISSFLSTNCFAEALPSMLTKKQRKETLPYFSTSYAQNLTTRPYFVGSYPGLEVGGSIGYRSLSDVQNDFPTDEVRDEIIFTQIFIKKSLVHRLELSFSSTVTSLGTTQLSGFGGMLTWHPYSLNRFNFLPILSIYTNYMNFEDSLTYQETGLQLSVGHNLPNMSFTGGLSLSQFSARFSGSSQGRQITASGESEKETVILPTYFATFSFEVNRYIFSLTQNFTVQSGWNPILTTSYQF